MKLKRYFSKLIYKMRVVKAALFLYADKIIDKIKNQKRLQKTFRILFTKMVYL